MQNVDYLFYLCETKRNYLFLKPRKMQLLKTIIVGQFLADLDISMYQVSLSGIQFGYFENGSITIEADQIGDYLSFSNGELSELIDLCNKMNDQLKQLI